MDKKADPVQVIIDSAPPIDASTEVHQQSAENKIPIDLGLVKAKKNGIIVPTAEKDEDEVIFVAEKIEIIDLTFTAAVITTPIIQPEAEIIHNSNSLSLLKQYSVSESDDDEEVDIKVIEKKIREPPVESDSDSDDETAVKKEEPLKVKGELTIDDLPPIQDLQITVDEEECMEIGVITTIVDQLLLVESFRNSAPLDIDSVLFLDSGKRALGKVFDVIGPVNVPIYCIRFNSNAEIVSKGIAVGCKVFYAPRTEHSSFVILSENMSKGSDASWKNDIEPPDHLIEYSDDEQERQAKIQATANRNQNRNREKHRE